MMSSRATFNIFLCSTCCHFLSIPLITLQIFVVISVWELMWWCRCQKFPESYSFMKTWLFGMLQGPLCINWGALLALFWSPFVSMHFPEYFILFHQVLLGVTLSSTLMLENGLLWVMSGSLITKFSKEQNLREILSICLIGPRITCLLSLKCNTLTLENIYL